MKKMKKFLIGALAMLMSCAGFVACSGGDTNESSNSSSESVGLLYELSSNGTYYSVEGIGRCTDTDLVIPSTYNNLPVTSIGSDAFLGRRSLTSVTIPDSVTSIGDYAFSWCSSLTSVTIPDSVTSIGIAAFSWCSSLTSVEIGDGVTSIYSVFSNCDSLTSVEIPDSVTNIAGAFHGCSGLTSVEIPDSVTSIGEDAFSDCSSLTSVKIPNSVTIIYSKAFKDCTSLTSVEIPDSVTSISEDVFSGWDALQYTVYDNAKYLGNENNPYVALIGTVDDDILKCTIHGQTKLIANCAFYECISLASVEIGNSVTSIGYTAFGVCSSLTSVVIPDSVTSIGYGAFIGCESLTSVEIGNSVTSIGYGAFKGCDSLTNIEVSKNNSVYKSIDGNLYTKDGKALIQYAIGKTATAFTIPNSVTSIGGGAFYECSSLTSVVIPDSVTIIDSDAFAGCSSLTSVVIPDSVTSIGDRAFRECSSLMSIIFNGTVEQWNAITKERNWNGDSWNGYMLATEVVCSDGVVAIEKIEMDTSSVTS